MAERWNWLLCVEDTNMELKAMGKKRMKGTTAGEGQAGERWSWQKTRECNSFDEETGRRCELGVSASGEWE